MIDVEEIPCQFGPYSLTLVDTPGFDNTTRSDAEVLQVGPVDGTVVRRGHVTFGGYIPASHHRYSHGEYVDA